MNSPDFAPAFDKKMFTLMAQSAYEGEWTRRIAERLAMAVCTKSSAEILQMVRDDPDILMKMEEQISGLVDFAKAQLEMCQAAEARLLYCMKYVADQMEEGADQPTQ